MKNKDSERSLDHQLFRGEYLPGDQEIISLLAWYPVGYYLRPVLDNLNESDEPLSLNKRNAINLMKKKDNERSLEHQLFRGEYLPGDR